MSDTARSLQRMASPPAELRYQLCVLCVPLKGGISDRVEPERILVAAVIHGSRLLQPFVPRIEGGPKSDE